MEVGCQTWAEIVGLYRGYIWGGGVEFKVECVEVEK